MKNHRVVHLCCFSVVRKMFFRGRPETPKNWDIMKTKRRAMGNDGDLSNDCFFNSCKQLKWRKPCYSTICLAGWVLNVFKGFAKCVDVHVQLFESWFRDFEVLNTLDMAWGYVIFGQQKTLPGIRGNTRRALRHLNGQLIHWKCQ